MISLPLLAIGLAGATEVSERKAYESVIREATAELRLYDGWHTALLARATLLTADVRSAQAARLAQLTADTASAPASTGGIEVLVSATSHWKDTLHLADDGSTAWTLSLLNGERRCSGQVDVVELKKPTELDRTLYPHITDWDRVFRLRWGADACGGGEPTALRVQGRRGSGELEWTR